MQGPSPHTMRGLPDLPACSARPAGLASSGQLPKAIDFVHRYPEALWSIMLLSAAATIGRLV